MKKLFLCLLFIALQAKLLAQDCQFEEQSSIVVIEAENLIDSNSDPLWLTVDDPEATNGKYIVWSGPTGIGSPTRLGVLTAKVRIETPGTFFFRIRGKQTIINTFRPNPIPFREDQANDVFVYFPGATIESAGVRRGGVGVTYEKVFMTTRRASANNPDNNFLYGGSYDFPMGRRPAVQISYDAPGVYDIMIAARSIGFQMDRFVLFTGGGINSPIAQQALDPSLPETACESTTPPPPPPAGNDSFFIVNRRTQLKIRPETRDAVSPIVQVIATASGRFVKWEKIDTDNGYFYLRNVATGMYFRPPNTTNGATIEQRPTTFSGNLTQWRQVPTANGYFYLQNRGTGQYFRPTGTAINDPMVQRPTTFSGTFTQWTFQEVTSSKNIIANAVNEINVYPNPVAKTGTVSISLPSSSSTVVSIMSLSGKVIISKQIQGSTIASIDLSGAQLNSGMYLLQVNQRDSSKILKLIVN